MDDGSDELNERYHRLLGEFLARFALAEWTMDQISVSYFDVGVFRTNPFRLWLLGRVMFRDKLSILKQILKDLDAHLPEFDGKEFKRLVRDLAAMMERRNELAHSLYFTSMEEVDGTWRAAGLVRDNRKAMPEELASQIELDLDQLEEEVEVMAVLIGELNRVWTHAEKTTPLNNPADLLALADRTDLDSAPDVRS